MQNDNYARLTSSSNGRSKPSGLKYIHLAGRVWLANVKAYDNQYVYIEMLVVQNNGKRKYCTREMAVKTEKLISLTK